MDGYPCPEGMSPEQYAQAQRIMEVTEDAFREERWRMACLLASKQDHELFGRHAIAQHFRTPAGRRLSQQPAELSRETSDAAWKPPGFRCSARPDATRSA